MGETFGGRGDVPPCKYSGGISSPNKLLLNKLLYIHKLLIKSHYSDYSKQINIYFVNFQTIYNVFFRVHGKF